MVGSMVAWREIMVLAKELRVLHLDTQAAKDLYPTLGIAWAYETSKPASIVIHFSQQGHTYSNKATSPNSATPYGPGIQTQEYMGAILIQTTTDSSLFWCEIPLYMLWICFITIG